VTVEWIAYFSVDNPGMYHHWSIVVVLAVLALLSVKTGKLDGLAGATGFITALAIYVGAGYTGILMLATFFVLGTTATSWGLRQKRALGIAEKNKGRRTSGQVLANAGVSAVLALSVLVFPTYADWLLLMIAGSLASATADTMSSELGNVYGKRFYNILTFRKDQRGLDGVISLEGTIVGIAGSFFTAGIYAFATHSAEMLLIIVVAGTIGNISDSVLGASLERKNYLGNNAVNFINTGIAAIAALALAAFRPHLAILP
jgi:uncharacterized protein (TIGR00297 family)